ncbi:MAG: nucleotidyltransferase family protein [Pseudomonadota bacterium]
MRLEDISAVLLASGLARRFGGDKLMARLNDAPVLQHAAKALEDLPFLQKIAVVGADQAGRRRLLEARGWTIVDNPSPESGQGASLALGAQAALNGPGEAVLIALGDMPFAPGAHYAALGAALAGDVQAAMTVSQDIPMPPAVFRTDVSASLVKLGGDRGARAVFDRLDTTQTVPLSPHLAKDVDTREDLRSAEAAHG